MLKNEAEQLKDLILREQVQTALRREREEFLTALDMLGLLRELANGRDKRQWAIKTLTEYATLSAEVRDTYIIGQLQQEACWRINGQYKQELLNTQEWVVFGLAPTLDCYEVHFTKDGVRYKIENIYFEDANA